MFNGFLAENAHLVSEKCAPYKGTTKKDKCGNYTQCDPIAKIVQSSYIEVSQNEISVNERKIQKEILRNGAVVGDFKAPKRFKYYDKGILMDGDGPRDSSLV